MSTPAPTPINATTRVCAVLGSPIRHSASPAMHNAAFEALGLNWRYLAYEVAPENLRAAIEGAKVMGFAGLNLTLPHKVIAMNLVDALDESARQWGAVNTIRFEGLNQQAHWLPISAFDQSPPKAVRAHGFNTDAEGLQKSLHEDLSLDLRGKSVLLLGAGGAGRMAALKCAQMEAAGIYLVNRTPAKSSEIAAEISRKYPRVSVNLGYPAVQVDLLINATSLGLKPEDPLPFDEQKFSSRQARSVYDMIYKPAETRLLSLAKAAGCKVANGLGMLVGQGAQAFGLWTGKEPPVEIMRRAADHYIYGH